MDIANLSTSLSKASTINSWGTALLSKSLDQAKTTGDNLVEMIDSAAMERSVNPNIGSNIDYSV